MKVLFVCYANIGRSQTAKALYDYWTKTNEAKSAGTGVNETSPECETLGQFELKEHHRPSTSVVMSEKFGLDTSYFRREQLTPEMLPQYDLVVNIADRNQTPGWLRGDNVIWWNIPDLGPKFSDEQVWRNFDWISGKVRNLIDNEKSHSDFHELDDNIDAENE